MSTKMDGPYVESVSEKIPLMMSTVMAGAGYPSAAAILEHSSIVAAMNEADDGAAAIAPALDASALTSSTPTQETLNL